MDSTHNSRNRRPVPIAVVGMGCRLPGGVDSPDKLWRLISDGGSAWTDVPQDRWNWESFHHPDPSVNEGINHRGGHFLQVDPAAWDANFFGVAPGEAKSLDPQQRILLETSYEALENAGIPLQSIRGSNTAVYVATFSQDWETMLLKDTHDLLKYHVLGTHKAIVANRVSYFFDFKGPSMTVDTACSGGLVALHLACQSLRTGESNLALASGTNLILSPELMFGMSFLNMLNDDGKSYSFDERGAGYGRGEGVATLVLKRLDDALADGDHVRAIIPNTGVNQDGKTNGISYPSQESQQMLAEAVYAEACLDPLETDYVEAHGTGTKAGDKLEISAIRQVFCQGRDSELLVGTIKANLGHLECTSGLAAVIKTVLALEKGLIPAVPGIMEIKASLRDIARYPLRIPTAMEAWPSRVRKNATSVRRASVQSFGFGGTNAHVILETARTSPLIKGNIAITHAAHVEVQEKAQKPQLFIFTAKATKSLSTGIKELKDWVYLNRDNISLQDLAHTLSNRRSLMAWRSTCVAYSVHDLLSSMGNLRATRAPLSTPPPVVFLFTGQGAQWFAMGRELLQMDGAFRDSIIKSEDVLNSLGLTWRLLDELQKDGTVSRISESEVAQIASTAIQVALIDLLQVLQVVPEAVVGHSSGEIAAAYAVGALSRKDAMIISLCRSQIDRWCREMLSMSGAMMAVGLGEAEVLPYVKQSNQEQVRSKTSIACINSPVSTTITGDREAVEGLQKVFEANSIFSRLLKVDTAYHSHHMEVVALRYEQALGNISGGTPSATGIRFFSSVTTQEKSSGFGSKYWVENLVSQVRFSEAVESLCRSFSQESASAPITPLFVEIGPHAALKGPLLQTLQALQISGLEYQYTSALIRGQDARQSVLATVGKAFELGCTIDIGAANFLGSLPVASKVLTDLPPYAWDHSTKYWHESRLSKSYRLRQYPYHDILGLRVVSGNSINPTWRQILGVERQPWLRDHVVDSFMVFPGSGYICMAVEAVIQLATDARTGNCDMPVSHVKLRDVHFLKALVIPHSPETVELQLLLIGGGADVRVWREFSVVSISQNGQWSEHCRGCIAMSSNSGIEPNDVEGTREIDIASPARAKWLQTTRNSCTVTLHHDTIYSNLKANGNLYGPAFADIQTLKLGDHRAVARVQIPDIRSQMPGKYMQPHLIHPTTLDAIMHAFLPLNSQSNKSGSVMPISIGELVISPTIPNQPGRQLEVVVESTPSGTNKIVVVEEGETDLELDPLVSIADLRTVAIGNSQQSFGEDQMLADVLHVEWEVDADFLPSRPDGTQTQEQLEEHVAEYLLCYARKKMGMKILEAGPVIGGISLARIILTSLNERGRAHTSYDITERSPKLTEELKASVSATDMKGVESVMFRTFDISHDPLTQRFGPPDMESYDVVIVNDVLRIANSLEKVLRNARKLLSAGGALVMIGKTDLSLELTLAELDRILPACSFSGLEPVTTGWDASENGENKAYYCAVSTAIASAKAVNDLLPVQVISDTSGKLRDFASQLCCALANHSPLSQRTPTSICSLGLPQGPINPKSIYIVLDEGSSPLLLEPSSSRFADIKALALHAKFILWISMRADGFNSTSEADMQMVTGFTRVIRKENDGLRLVSLVVKQDLPKYQEIIHAIIRILQISFHEKRDQMCELEYQYVDGKMLVPRLRPARNYQHWRQMKTASRGGQVITEVTNFSTPERPLKMNIEVPGLLSSIRFTNDEHRMPLGPLEVDIQAKAYGVNNKSVEIAMGHAGHPLRDGLTWVSEWSGVITAIGSGLKEKWKVGDKVCGLGSATCSPYASNLRIGGSDLDLMRPLPSTMTFSNIVSVLLPFTTAYHALGDLARLEASQTVLIHDAGKAVGQAAVMIAQLLGAEIFVTVRDRAESTSITDAFQIPESHIYSSQSTNYRQGILRQTADRGVDVIIMNSLNDVNFKDSWACLSKFGTFIDIGGYDNGCAMSPAGKNAVFTSLDLGLLVQYRPTAVCKAMNVVMKLIEHGKIGAISPINILPINEIEDAFRLVSKRQTPGKVVLEIDEGALVKATVPPQQAELELPADATYVIPGGLGSLGERICLWMAEHGAKHIVTLTRSGSTRYPDTTAVLEQDLERLGAKLYRPACDITNEARVHEVAEWCAARLPPVRGIIQSAALFADKMLENMDVDLFNGGVRPKRAGTMNVYNAFASDKLDAFILLSSASTVLGGKGQTHYNSGNSFQEGFTLQKLAGQAVSGSKTHFVTIQPSLIRGSDSDVTHAQRRKMFHRQGGGLVEFSEVLSLIEYSMGPQARRDGYAQLVLGVDPNVIPDDGTYNLRVMTDILQTKTGNSSADMAGGTSRLGRIASILQRLSAAGDSEQMSSMVIEALAGKLRELVAIGQDDLRQNIPLIDLGVDSLVAIEIKNWVGREFESSLQTSEVLDAPNIITLAENVLQKSKLVNKDDGTDIAKGTTLNGVGKDGDGQTDKLQTNGSPDHGFECCTASKELPVMPLLDLDQVLDLYLKSIKHLMTPDELTHMVNQLNKLKEPGGLGRQLYARLMDRFKDPTIDNWLFEPANEQVYTGRDYPISPWSSFAGTDAYSKFPHMQAERAAIVSLSALEFKRKLEARMLEATVIGGRPQCMYQHGWLFNTFREPVVGTDQMRKMPSENYIAVLRRGRLFKVDLVDSQGATIRFIKLQATFQAILDKVQDNYSWVGILTADDRNSWAEIRQAAKELHLDNKQYLDTVEGAAFLVCLDDGSPTNTEERMERMLLNDGFNRWFDKGLKLIICSNGISGSHMEHSMIDGTTVRELYDARTEAIENHQRSNTNGELSNGLLNGLQLEEYTFHTTPTIDDHIAHVRARYLQETSLVGFTTWSSKHFSQDYFQARRLPAKGICETMVQLASKYYLGKNYPCWSAISMGHYHKGRIEIIQTYTAEMQGFCDVIDDTAVSARAKRALLIDAARSHGPNLLRAQQGRGYERTIVALETQLRDGETIPEIFRDPVYQSMRPHWVMTGSTDIGGAGGGEFGFILRHLDSIWLQYLIDADGARFAIVMNKKIGRFLECMDNAARVVQELLELE